ncbi:MAG: hypothetical protein Q8N53_11005 [Longimicrobiales bacterium]|nr:hypothetical protein [Longimicrobiales bacterium]
MRLRAAVAAAALLAVLAPTPAVTQVRGVLPKVLTLPASTRAMALGNAYQPTARHADGLFYNPALLVGSTGFGIEIQQWSHESSSATAAAAGPWLGGGVAIGLQSLQFSQPSTSAPDGQDHLFASGRVAVSERVATVGYARKLFGVELGGAAKLAEVRLGGARSTVALVDLGAARGVGPFVVGLAVKDLGERPFDAEDDGEGEGGDREGEKEGEGEGEGADSPRIVLGAGAYGQPVGIFDLGLSAAVSHGDDRTSVGGGVELGYWPVNGRTFLVRLGAQSVPSGSDASPLTFGFAFWGDDLRLEWAYQDFGASGSGTHRFGVSWH